MTVAEQAQDKFAHSVQRKCVGRASLAFFALAYFKDRLDNKFGEFQLQAMDELENIQPGEAVLKLWPRGHAKTTIISLIYVTWCIAYRRAQNIVVFSETSDQAKEFLRNIKQELESNEILREDFGDMVGHAAHNGGVWNVQHIVTANRVQVRAKAAKGQTRGLNAALPADVYWAGPGSSAIDESTEHMLDPRFFPPDCGQYWKHYYERRGEFYLSFTRRSVRPNLVILDDILEDKQVKNEAIRKDLWRWFWAALWNAIDHKNGKVVIVGTILHEEDLLNKLYNDKEQTEHWKKSRLPACEGFEQEEVKHEYTATEGKHKGKVVLRRGAKRMRPLKALWPDRWGGINPRTGQYYLWEQRKAVGELAFAIEFLLEPIDDTVRIIRRDWIRYYMPTDVVIPQEYIRELQTQFGYVITTLPADLIVCTAVDPAISEREKADNTVISTMGYSSIQQKFYELELTRRKMSVKETVLEIMRHVQKWSMEFGGAARDQFGRVLERGHAYEHLGVVIEVNAYQKALYQAFKLMHRLMGHSPRIVQRHESRDKRYRFIRMQPYFEDLRVCFPIDMVAGFEKPEITDAINEIVNIGVAAHDDCPDAIERNLSLLTKYAIWSGYDMDGGSFLEMLASEYQEYAA